MGFAVKVTPDERSREMRNKSKLFLILVVSVVLVAVGTGAVIGMSNASRTSGELVVKVGETVEIILEENPSTGYSWIPIQTCEGKVEVLRDYYQEAEAIPGAPGKHVWVIKGLEKGSCELLFHYTRPWEENGTIEEKTISIKVR